MTAEHYEKDRRYHDIIAEEYDRVIVNPRELINDALFRPLMAAISPPPAILS
ncbi:MAG: hypothetical protein ACXIUL_13510 [Wenzhouxiangella sp.]